MLCRGLRARLPHCRGLCTGRPVCPGASGRLRCVCGRVCSRVCKARGRSVRGRRDALILAAGLTRRRPVCGRTQRPLLEGRRHRGTDPPASLGEAASREAPQQHIADPRSAALARRCVPVRSCSSRWRAACDALNSPALHAVSEDRGGTRARRGRSGACTHPLLRPVQDSVRHPALRTATDVYYLSVTPCLYI